MTQVRVTERCRREDWPVLPHKLQVDLVGKLNMLALDPQVGKPLWGALRRYRTLRLGRYRIVYCYDQETDIVWVVVVGIRREGSRDDVIREGLTPRPVG